MAIKVAAHDINWQEPGLVLTTAAQQIDLWKIPLDRDDSLMADRECLSESELDRGQRLQRPEHRQRYINGRTAMRYILSTYSHISAKQIAFNYGEKGKPTIANQGLDYISFNYSDANRVGLLAVAQNTELGIDIEPVDRKIDFLKVARRKYTELEQHALNELHQDQQRLGFLALWTRKEAYGKALGVGIHYPLNQFTLARSLSKPDYQLACQHSASRQWLIQQLRIDSHHIASLVSPAPASTLNTYLFNPAT